MYQKICSLNNNNNFPDVTRQQGVQKDSAAAAVWGPAGTEQEDSSRERVHNDGLVQFWPRLH